MPIRFKILGSSSAGNCALLQTENSRVLVDAGFSARRICEMLEACGESIDGIDAVFITHEPGDHVAGLRGLSRHPHLKVFANAFTAEAVQTRLKTRLDWRIFQTGQRFTFRDLEIDPFALPHDAHDPVGFVFTTGGGDLFQPRSAVGWVLDLGYIPEMVRERIRGVDVLVMEANHDSDLLKNHVKRPWSLKQRISGRHGHLSNESARELIEGTPDAGWKQVYLAHLSGDCNTVDHVKRSFARSLNNGLSHTLSIVAPGDGTPFFELPQPASPAPPSPQESSVITTLKNRRSSADPGSSI